MTTTKASLGRVEDIVDEYRGNGLQELYLRPLSPYGFAVKTKWFKAYDISEWLTFYRRGLRYIVDMNKGGDRMVELYAATILRSEEHTSELQSLMRISYAVFCLKKKKKQTQQRTHTKKKKKRQERKPQQTTD